VGLPCTMPSDVSEELPHGAAEDGADQHYLQCNATLAAAWRTSSLPVCFAITVCTCGMQRLHELHAHRQGGHLRMMIQVRSMAIALAHAPPAIACSARYICS
jgi:hypothetical protein